MTFKEFLDNYGGWLLAGLSSIGVIATAALAADEVPKAKQAICDKERDQKNLTRWEKVKTAVPIMLPSIISGGLTIGTIFGNQALNVKQQEGLAIAAAGYTAIRTEYEQYRKTIREMHGAEADEQALRMAKMRLEELESELKRLHEENGPYLYSISTIPGVIFEANPADIQEAFLHFNRNLVMRGMNDLAELYAFIGIPENCYDQDDSFRYGWNDYVNSVTWDACFVDFNIEKVETGNGTAVRMISMAIPPYDMTIDYDHENIMDHEYPAYNYKTAKKYIEDLAQVFWDSVVKIEHPFIYRTGII